MRKLKITEMHRLTADQYRRAPKVPLTVVLDDVRSANNVGSILRTCDAFRIQQVVLCGITPQPPLPAIHKTALGAEDSVSWRHVTEATETLTALRTAGYTLWAVEQCEGSMTLDQAADIIVARCRETLPTSADISHAAAPGINPVAIIFGNEVRGVDQRVIDLCHACIEIPQYGTKHSLNVAVAAGIVIHRLADALRQPATKQD